MTLPRPSADPATRRARALADGTRRRLLDQLHRAALDVRTLAMRMTLHENAVRQHLAVLADAGLVVASVERVRGRAGRPRLLYRAVDGTTLVNPFERLAALLADVAAGHDAARVGAAEGARLAANHAGRDAADVVADIAAGNGFAVQIDRDPDRTRVVLGGCPFAAIAGPVVCALHRGVAEGAARAAGGSVVDFDVADPAVHPCELTLAPELRRIPMTDIQTHTLGDLVAANPAAARVFEPLGLDYCCHGDRTLDDACTAAGIDPSAVVEALTDLEVEGDTTWISLDPPALAAHIVETHHRYLHEELPLLDALADKVLSVHGERHPELGEVRRLVAAVRADLEPHLMKEERVLFPAIDALAHGPTEFPFGTVANPIRMMMFEHDRAGELLAELRTTTAGYTVPADGCASYRSLYERLAALELDTHLHIHKENYVLFPATLRLEAG